MTPKSKRKVRLAVRPKAHPTAGFGMPRTIGLHDTSAVSTSNGTEYSRQRQKEQQAAWQNAALSGPSPLRSSPPTNLRKYLLGFRGLDGGGDSISPEYLDGLIPHRPLFIGHLSRLLLLKNLVRVLQTGFSTLGPDVASSKMRIYAVRKYDRVRTKQAGVLNGPRGLPPLGCCLARSQRRVFEKS